MSGKTLIQVIGLQRSGNHAVINWLASLFGTAAHQNDLPHDYFSHAENLAAIASGKAECSIFSFEDSRGKFRENRSLLESVGRVDPATLPDFDCHVIHILRDPYNCWASRVRARETGRLTSSSALDAFISHWVELARLRRTQRGTFILYNAWFKDQAYRKKICARLGGSYSEQTLGEILGLGGGSSFDGFVRPSYRTILRKFDYYLTSDFRRRFLKAPGSYVSRLFSPSLDGRQLQVDRRWEHIIGREDSRPLFDNEEVRALATEIFGFHVDSTGQIVTAGAGTSGLRKERHG
jgi:hypothetical protein